MILFILLGVVVLLALYAIVTYNGLVRMRNRIQNAWAQIDVQLRRRYDLIPNLVETVKGYATHEKGTLKSLFAVSEAYPDLKANQNFLSLQEELSGTEGRISYARQFYNDAVLRLNTKIQSFPSNVLAGMFGFNEHEYFEADDTSRGPVSVKF